MQDLFKNLNKENLIKILKDNSLNQELFNYANKIRKDNVGNEVHLRALIEISNICKNNCLYCGIRRDNENIIRYKMLPQEILDTAKTAINSGYKTIVLQSGESNCYSTEEFLEIIKEIKKYDVAITLSLGEKSFEEYQSLKIAGADRFLLRIETTDKKLYKQMHPNMDLQNRINCLKNLKKLGYELGTGCIVGLLNQSIDSLADDILFFKEIEADMIGVGPFIPTKNTPLENASSNNFELSLKVMALTRILLPKINIPATTAMESLHKNGKILALNSGANVLMLNVNDFKYKQNYKIYNNKILNENSIMDERNSVIQKLHEINRSICNDKGNSKTKKDT